jgi:hypothetical protein
MGLTLGDLYTASLLFLNAIAILNEERFLAKCMFFFVARRIAFARRALFLLTIAFWGPDGWSTNPDINTNPNSLKAKLLAIVKAVRLVMMCKFPKSSSAMQDSLAHLVCSKLSAHTMVDAYFIQEEAGDAHTAKARHNSKLEKIRHHNSLKTLPH